MILDADDLGQLDDTKLGIMSMPYKHHDTYPYNNLDQSILPMILHERAAK